VEEEARAFLTDVQPPSPFFFSEGNTVKLKFTGHTGWVSTVKWSPTNPYVFASGSYDGLVKIWDIRSESALFSCAGALPDQKVLSLDWVDNLIFAGGSDSLLHALEYQG
jgi:ribosome biogenesis protein YTM1